MTPRLIKLCIVENPEFGNRTIQASFDGNKHYYSNIAFKSTPSQVIESLLGLVFVIARNNKIELTDVEAFDSLIADIIKEIKT